MPGTNKGGGLLNFKMHPPLGLRFSFKLCFVYFSQLFPVPYLCQLSQLMGCYPSIWTYLMQGDFKLAHHLLFKPFYPYVMRLTGKHAWSGARRAIFDARDNMFSATRSPPSPGARSRSGFLAVLSVVSCVIFMLIAISRLSGISLWCDKMMQTVGTKVGSIILDDQVGS